MDGIHDVGGMDSFRRLPPDQPDDASPFHHEWEGIVQALYLAGLGSGAFHLDRFRYELETHEPEYYLETPYYERWLTAVESLFDEAGVVDRDELLERARAIETGEREVTEETDPERLPELLEGVRDVYMSEREGEPGEPAFSEGDRVRVRKEHPSSHTRCPRYVRGCVGEVVAVRGTHVFPDANAHGEERAEPLYNVRFEASELWGESNTDGDGLHIELWEPYLDSV